MESEADEARSKLENFKYYTSLILGTLCIVCIFAFLFLVPFVLDPAISTLMHEFVDTPVSCKVSSVQVRHGKSHCKWSSCREGCTADMYVCYQVRVGYSLEPWSNKATEGSIREWVDLMRYDANENATMQDTPLLVNIKGCGYPPDIDCAAFANKYQNMSEQALTFPCYYSKLNPWIVLETYSFGESVGNVVASIAIPNGVFVISLIVLLYWYCPYCQARCRKYEEQTDQEDKDIVDFEMEDDEEEERTGY
eukprot:maker-scaffold464_size163657-snap-gene-0.30 protein:Tk05268 transcript:maker-scaffold464_size163657-snap-gene-0.30-mRNA-1 annotation:"sodium auxiliary"